MSERIRPPGKRRCITVKKKANNRSIFITVSFYPGEEGRYGKPCELFLDAGKDGSEMQSLMDALSMGISLALQHGCSVETIVQAYKDFNPDEFPFVVSQALKEACRETPTC